MLFEGMKESRRRTWSMRVLLALGAKCATPDFAACDFAPPRSSKVVFSPVTLWMTSGPVMYICEVPSTMKMKSVMAGRVDGAAGARPHDHADLRDHARGAHVAQEDVAVAGEGGDAFLDARAARVVQADHGRAGLHGEVHHLGDLVADDLAEEPPKTVKSWAKTKTWRPSILPQPVTTASP